MGIMVKLRAPISIGIGIGRKKVVPSQLQLKGRHLIHSKRTNCHSVRCYANTNKYRHSSSSSMSSSEDATPTPISSEEDVLVQYVVLRRDLIDTWPLGSVVTQGCHASVAAIWQHKDDSSTLSYCSPSALDSMHKVTLEVKGETQIVNLSEKLKSSEILHKLWIEQPENIPTCLATKPYPKSVVSPFFRKLKLCK